MNASLRFNKRLHRIAQKSWLSLAGILRESEVKINDYSKAFGGADMKTELRRYLTEELFKPKLNQLNAGALRAVMIGPIKNIWHVFNGND